VEGDTIETETLFVRDGAGLVRANGMPPRAERFARAGIDVHGLLSGRA
jgi:pilus assembly protein CpaF